MIRSSFLHGINWYAEGELRAPGFFGGGYRIAVKPAATQASWAFLFAGQGAAHPGMLRDQYRRPEIRAAYGKADALAATMGLPPISDHIRAGEGTDPTAFLPVQNLSLFVLEVALFDSLLCRGIFPRALTSHSFGEYAMLVAAGVLPFEEAFAIVAHREKISPPANAKGYLVAVNADRDRTAQLMQGKNVHLSNFNSPSQTVIAVTAEGALEIESFLKERGVRAKRLATPQPYHSPLLLALKPEMRKFLRSRKWNVSAPTIPFVSSVLHRWVDAASFREEDIQFILENQLVEPVDFIRQVSLLGDKGSHQLMEIGPTLLLSPLARECGARETQWVGEVLRKTPRKKAAAPKSSRPMGRVLGIVNEVIGKITGYKIEEISLEDRFQEDLGIDSIKKTEILFSVMDRLNFRPEGEVNYSRFTKVEDLVGYIETTAPASSTDPETAKVAHFERCRVGWVPQALDPVWKPTIEPSPLMIPLTPDDFAADFDPVPLATEFCRQLALCRTRQVILVATGFVSDLSLTADGTLVNWLEHGLPAAAVLIQEILRQSPQAGSLSLGLVTMGQGSLVTEAMGAFFKSLRKERPEFQFKHIRLDDADPKVEALRWIRDEMRDPVECEVRYRDGTRYVSRLEPVPEPTETSIIHELPVVVAIGGAKGITHSLLSRLPNVGDLYLCGRSSETEVMPQLDALRESGVRVHYSTVDATRSDELGPFLEWILETHGHIDLILHASGIEVSRNFSAKSREEIEAELWSKALGAANLVRAVAANPPARILFFSSVVAWFGNPGQTIYAAANAILDRFCLELNAAWGPGTAASILWPPWDGVGMTANRAIRQTLVQKGLSLLTPERAVELFRRDLSSPEPRVIYFDETDASAYGAALPMGFPELLGEPVSGRGIFRYEKNISAAEPYLNDHRIDGLAYLPAAAGVAMSLGALYLHRKRWVPLAEFSARSPIVIGDKGALLSLEARTGPETLELTIATDLGSFQSREGTPSDDPAPVWLGESEPRVLSSQWIYGADGLFHGPAFRTLTRLLVEPTGGAVANVDLSGVPELFAGSFWGKLIQWIDTAFQMTAIVELDRAGHYCLPVRVEKVTPYFQGPLSPKSRLRLEHFQSDGSRVQSEVSIFDESGRCWLWLRGIEMTVVRRAARFPARSAN